MTTRRQRSQRRPPTFLGVPVRTDGRMPRGIVALVGPPPRRDRVTEVADLTASECDRHHLEEVRPLLALAVTVGRAVGLRAAIDHAAVQEQADLALAAAVRIAGPCPTGWCAYPAGHTGDHQPLEAA